MYIIFQQTGILSLDNKSKPFIEALKTGKFPKEELEKFVAGQPSLVDDVVNKTVLSLEDQVTDTTFINVAGEVPADRVDDVLDESKVQADTANGLPVIETKDILAALDNRIISSADEEAVEFLVTSACAKIWKNAFLNEQEENRAVKVAEAFQGGEYATRVKDRFLDQYRGATSLHVPAGYSFTKAGKLVHPNLMQRLAAYLVQTRKKVGNWSGTGAGKTLSAILASRVIDGKLTIICCPNSVVKGWKDNIEQIFPDSRVFTKTLSPQIDYSNNNHYYLVLNYETFQQENSEALVKRLLDTHPINFIVIDEIHYSKQRVVEDVSKRRRVITGMVTGANSKNPDLHVLGMSATPVINNLYEGKTLLEMVTGVSYDELKTVPTVNNCMALYQKLAATGIRWMPAYTQKLNLQIIDVDCAPYLDEIKALGVSNNYVDLEAILTKARLPEIRRNITPKTLIYTHYLKGIQELLKAGIEQDGWKVSFFTGDDKSGLDSFIEGDTDVLIASSAISTGVDGLQEVCNRLIVNILPWTSAEFEQLKGRIYRQGQKQQEVDVIVPLTHAEVNGQDWSWCQSKWGRIQFKKSIADAAVDGVVPEGHLRSPAQAYEDTMKWLQRLEAGDLRSVERRVIHIPLSDTVIQGRIRRFGDFSAMNRRMNTSTSQTTHERFTNHPEEWELYHALYREARKEWSVIPYEEVIDWCKKRPDFIIGDFGCGEAKLAKAIGSNVYSFDHVAVNDNVVAGDMTHVPLEDETLDVAVFSLSLMGTNFTDYLREAHRCLKLDGDLWIIEATARFSDLDEFKKGLKKLGFDVVTTEERYKFTFIRAIKSDRAMTDIELHF